MLNYKKAINVFFNIIIAVSIISSNGLPAVASVDDTNSKVVSVECTGSGQKITNGKLYINGFSSNTVDGKPCLTRDAGNTGAGIFINIDDKYWYSSEKNRVAITLDYYDGEAGSFSVLYYAYGRGSNMPMGTIETKNTKQWKTVRFYTEDFVAANRMSDYDIRIRSTGWDVSPSKPVSIGNITVEKDWNEYTVDAKVYNGMLGCIFDYGEDNQINILFKNNNNEKVSVSADYSILNNEGRGISKGSLDKKEIETMQTDETKIPLPVSECGTYTLQLSVDSKSESGVEEKYTKEFEFSILQTVKKNEERYRIAGVAAHLDRAMSAGLDIQDSMSRIGFSTFRSGTSSNWSGIETSKGVYNDSILDNEANTYSTSKGLDEIYTAMQSNPLYNGNRGAMTVVDTDEMYNGYANYVKHLVQTKKIKYLEVLNEPQHPAFGNISADIYVKLCKVAYDTAKAIDPEIKIVACNTAGVDTAFITKFLKKGGYDVCDVISVHPYQGGGFNIGLHISQIQMLQQLSAQYGNGKPKEIIYTESGWSRASDGKDGVSESERRIYSPQLLLINHAEKLADKVCFYELIDTGPVDSEREHRWGLLKFINGGLGGQATDSMVTVAAVCKLFAGAEPIGSIKTDTATAYNFKFVDGKNIASLWSESKNANISLKLGCNQLQTYDMYGTKKEILHSDDGIYSFDLSDDITYIEGDFEEFTQSAPVIKQDRATTSAISGDYAILNITDNKKRNLKLTVDCDEAIFTPKYPEYLTDGTADIKLKVKDDITGEYHINITLSDENGTVYTARDLIKIVDEPIQVKMQTVQSSKESQDRWDVEVKITNLSNTISYNGVCKIISPIDYTGSERQFLEVEPSETRLIKLNLPELVKKRPEELTVGVKLSNGFEKAYTNKLDFTSASYAGKPPTIDGVEETGEWKGVLVSEDRGSRVYMTNSSEKWGGTTDLSMTARFAWDEDNFYMLVRAKDNIFSQDNDPYFLWQGDGVQFGILETKANGIDDTASTYTEIGFGLLKSGPTVYRYSSMDGQNVGAVTNFKGAVKRNADETVYELKIPWSEILSNNHKAKMGDIYGFSMLVNDSDGNGRHCYIYYNDGIGTTKSSALFGRMALTK